MELAPNAIVAGKLRLVRRLGEGGMGVVWQAEHLGLGMDVAVKLLRPERVVSRSLVARFEREARATARITHPNVVRVMDVGADRGVPFLVMELLQGYSLAELLERGGRLSVGTARALVEQVAAALQSAHDVGIVHRDVKPHNVFLTRGTDTAPLFVKVLDFGVAKLLAEAEVPGASAELTETGMVIGSPPYMSPEQIEGRRDVDLRADLWSLGVIVYECLTGTRPFQGGSFVAVGSAVLDGRYRPATELRPNLPAALDHWFAKALSVDPDGRFGSAREMAEAFLAIDARARPDDAPPSEEPPGDPLAPLETATTQVDVRAEPPRLDRGDATETHAPPDAKDSAGQGREARPAGERTPARRSWLRARGPWLALPLAVALGASGLLAYRRAHPGTCPAGMVLVPGATFPMGSLDEGETPSDETPLHRETVEGYCLDRTEVTVAAYLGCASCPPAQRTVEFEGLTPNGRLRESQLCNGPDAAEHPMNCVDWAQAAAYCEAQGKRLPTEPEWELAASGPRGRPYPWGAAPPPAKDVLNACGGECARMLAERQRGAGGAATPPALYPDDDGAPTTAPVGSFPRGASPEGALDLAGNVWEWTASPYCPYDRPSCGDSRRVLRGGGWDSSGPRDVRASRRFPGAPTARGRSIGFRCAKSL